MGLLQRADLEQHGHDFRWRTIASRRCRAIMEVSGRLTGTSITTRRENLGPHSHPQHHPVVFHSRAQLPARGGGGARFFSMCNPRCILLDV